MLARSTDHAFLGDTIVVYRPVAVNGQRIGTLKVVADLGRWHATQERQILLVALLLLAMLGVTGAFAWRLQSQITRPIDDLLATIGEITRRKDYSIRAEAAHGDEFGRLVQGLNGMLGEIQARDLSLQAAHVELRAQVQRLDAEVAERERAEQAVRELNERLEARVHERTRDLEHANAELESFASSVSHDLRAPLRAILGHIAALREDSGTRLTPEAQDRINRTEAAANRMSRLIDALLNLARISRTELRVREVDLSDMATRIAEELRHAEPERKVECRVTPQLRAHGDPALLEVVMRNLLGNAWKFTRGRSVAHVEVGRYATPEGDVLFVRDDGAGFDMNYVSKLFGAFQRLHTPQEFEGTGIGLATVQRVVSRHGGRVWAEGQPDAGATVYFSLPRLDRAA
jgi:signal transduction histidine kinase